MGTRSLPLISFPPSSSLNPNLSSHLPCSVSGGLIRARWDSKLYGSNSKFDFSAKARSREKQRKWWSDDDEDDDDEDADEDGGFFELFQDPRTFNLAMKVLGTLGWIIPNVIMSSMMDTGFKGQDALFMALMLPLGQVAISFVIDKIQGSSRNPLNPKSRRKQKPFGRARSRTRPRSKTRKRNYQTAQGRTTYQSWPEADSGLKSSSDFGGWDELDEQGGNFGDYHRAPPSEDEKLTKVTQVRNAETEWELK